MSNTNSVSAKEKYDAGSKALQNYSTLTKDLRVVAFQVMAGFAVTGAAVVASFAKSSATASPGTTSAASANGALVSTAGDVLFSVSICVYLFAFALFAVNTHYATAFLFIRDSLAELEGGSGPWSSHKVARKGMRDEFAYALPFVVLAAAAIGGMSISGTVYRDSVSGEICARVASLFAVAVLVGWAYWMRHLRVESQKRHASGGTAQTSA